MEVTESGTAYSASRFPAGYVIRAVLFLSNRTPSSELYVSLSALTDMEARDVQYSKA